MGRVTIGVAHIALLSPWEQRAQENPAVPAKARVANTNMVGNQPSYQHIWTN
jgi:hypothetical protein